jgi:hypothetical protein
VEAGELPTDSSEGSWEASSSLPSWLEAVLLVLASGASVSP